MKMKGLFVLKFLFLFALIHNGESQIWKRKFPLKKFKSNPTTTNKFAGDCAKFQYFTQLVK